MVRQITLSPRDVYSSTTGSKRAQQMQKATEDFQKRPRQSHRGYLIPIYALENWTLKNSLNETGLANLAKELPTFTLSEGLLPDNEYQVTFYVYEEESVKKINFSITLVINDVNAIYETSVEVTPINDVRTASPMLDTVDTEDDKINCSLDKMKGLNSNAFKLKTKS